KSGKSGKSDKLKELEEKFLFARPDGVALPLTAQWRFQKLEAFRNVQRGVFYISRLPDRLDWSCGRVKESRAVLPGEVTPVTSMMLGQVSWNGMIPKDGAFPTKPRLSIKPLREADLMRARKIIQDMSCSAREVVVSNINSVSAHTDVGFRSRGSDKIQANPFSKLYDGQKKFAVDKKGMPTLRPAELMHGDVVLMEFSIGRYWDESKDGRVLNWNSNRVYFHLEAATLLVQGSEDGADAPANKMAAKGYSSMEEYF
ncbi:hypothetical protein PENSPDRAFT_672589, partial [Peniophora sp. CONT]